MLALICFVFGVSITVIGTCWWAILYFFIPITKAEVNMMKEGGKFEGEEDYMQTYRVARSEFDLESELHQRTYARLTVLMGIFIMAAAGFIHFLVKRL